MPTTSTDAVATQQSLASASSPQDLLRIQTECLAANQRQSVEYWRHLYEAAAETNQRVMSCLGGTPPKAQ